MKFTFILLFIVVIGTSQVAYSQSITLNGGWVMSVPSSTITEAGTDYPQTIQSHSNQTLVSILDGTLSMVLNFGWEVRISRMDNDWDPRLKINAIRTGSGVYTNLLSNVTGGTTPVEVTSTSRTFFTGVSTIADIPIQYQLSGLSVTIPARTYSTTIIYTLLN